MDNRAQQITAPAVARRDGDPPIQLRIQHVNQLFHTLDPFPFRERDLDAQVEEFVVSWARELGSRAPLIMSIHMPAAQARLRSPMPRMSRRLARLRPLRANIKERRYFKCRNRYVGGTFGVGNGN
jgi:hypothetical protein